MFNKPFYAHNTNVTDVGQITTNPITIAGHNVMVTQEQQHRIYDTTATTIERNGFSQQITCFNPHGHNAPQFLQSQKHFFPGGVTFTFEPRVQQMGFGEQQFNLHHQPKFNQFIPQFQQPITLEQQMAMKKRENDLQAMLFEEHIRKKPFCLNFHMNARTSTSDLLDSNAQVQKSKGLPDFNNISGIIEQSFNAVDFCCYNCGCDKMQPSSKVRQLHLSKSPDLTAEKQEIVVEQPKPDVQSTEVSGEPSTPVQKQSKVCFEDNKKEESQQQENLKQKGKKHKKKRKKKKHSKTRNKTKRYESESDTSASTSSSGTGKSEED